MIRVLRLLSSLLILGALAATSPASAQTSARRAVGAGEVRGLELGLEGALQATRGDPLRWLVAVHEVVGLSDLRPAAGAKIRIVTSFAPAEATELTADALGRATIEVPIPLDAPQTFGVVIELFARQGGVQRRFELSVTTRDPRVLELSIARGFVERTGQGRYGTVRAVARLTHRTSHRPLADVPLIFELRDAEGRPVGAPIDVRTDAGGLAAHAFRSPRADTRAFTVEARVREPQPPAEGSPTAQATVGVLTLGTPTLLVAVAPERIIAPPDTTLAVDIVVRTSDGRPVPHAALTVSGMPTGRDIPRIFTDARGRARVMWEAPDIGGPFQDVGLSVQASREGYGSGIGGATVRLANVAYAGSLAAEGGVFPSAIGGRIYVRVVGVDGNAAPAGVPVVLSGPRLGAAAAANTLARDTDADGIATFDVPALGPVVGEGGDACGGESATQLTARIGDDARAATVARCVPLDPDAAARVRAVPSVAAAGGHLRVEITRAAAARGLPVVVSLLVRDTQNGSPSLRAIASHVVPAAETISELTLPPDAVGQVLVRARPLTGRELLEVRGGMTSVWVTAGARAGTTLTLDGAAHSASLAFRGAPGDRSAVVVALPLDEARALARELDAALTGPLGELRRPSADAGESLLAAALAVATPFDVGAPAVLRGREQIAVPAPDAPETLGLLRDPWRARARFVGGRLALLFRALETAVDAAVPGRADDVAVRTPRGWDFNTLVLDSVRGDALGDAGATGLGGEPLTIDSLRLLDASFTYDNVARRITRKRLFTLMLALRQLVQQSALDLRWAVRGDPSEWLKRVGQVYVPSRGAVDTRGLVDAWGTPFELRPAAGGRARFAQLVPVVGYELVSAGPDTRFGTSDDVWDPTAAVLPAGGLYAEAVGETALVARLRGVELGRATVELAAGTFGFSVGYIPAQADSAPSSALRDAWNELPSRIERDAFALALRRPNLPGDGAGGMIRTLPESGGSVPLALDDEPRTWGAVAVTVTREGFTSVALGEAPAGAPVLVSGELPERVRVGEPITASLVITDARPATERAADARYAVTVVAPDGMTVDTPAEVTVPTEQSVELSVSITATRPVTGPLRVVLGTAGTSSPARTIRQAIAADEGRHPLRRRATGMARAGSAWLADLELPAGVTRPEARLVLLAPAALADDPDLDEARLNDPALVAWSTALAGRAISPALRARLLAAQQPSGVVSGGASSLSTAAAVLALATLGVEDAAADNARVRAIGALGAGAGFDDLDSEGAQLRTEAATLAALATGGTLDPIDEETSASDPVSAHLVGLRTQLRGRLRTERGEPSLLARAAAALLVADPRDGHGLAMLALAAASVEEAPGGVMVKPTDARRVDGTEALSATLALALAAHQAGDTALAQRLLGAATRHTAIATRLRGEPLFWLLACGAYGALGTGDAPRVSVTVDGRPVTATFDKGRAVIALPRLGTGAHQVRVAVAGEAAVLARVEAVFGAPFAAQAGSAFTLALAGDVGDAGGVAALELTLEAKRAVRQSVVDVQLPAGVRADESLLAALRGAPYVTSVEAREPGFVRILLGSLDAGVSAVLPLPLRFTGSGRLHGLGVVAYPAAVPADMTVLAPRELSLSAPAE
jgi:hypothetical protein